jgi:hypothetical protein
MALDDDDNDDDALDAAYTAAYNEEQLGDLTAMRNEAARRAEEERLRAALSGL